MLFFVPLLLNAQDYKLFNTHRETYFINAENEIQAIRIDSALALGADSVFKNFQSFTISLYHSPCLSSWIGSKIVKQADGTHFCFNSQKDSIKFLPFALLNQHWKMYIYPNKMYLKAQVVKIAAETFLGITDSVKTIRFSQFDSSGNAIANMQFSKTEFKLSKNHGLIQGYNLYNFPVDTSAYSICGMNNPVVGMQNLTAKEVFNYNVGDEFHHYSSSTNIPYYGDYISSRTKVLSKTISANGDSIIYTDSLYEVHKHIVWSQGTGKNYTTLNDTIIKKIIILSEYSFLDKLPMAPLYTVDETNNNNFISAKYDLATLSRKKMKPVYEYVNQGNMECYGFMILGGLFLTI